MKSEQPSPSAQEDAAFWAAQEAKAQLALDRRVRAMPAEERVAFLAQQKAAEERMRVQKEKQEREEEELKKALSGAVIGTKSESITQTSKKLNAAIETLSKGEDEAFRVYLKTKIGETEKKIQRGLMSTGSIDEKDSEDLAKWQEELAKHEAKVAAENPYEEITIEDWKKKN